MLSTEASPITVEGLIGFIAWIHVVEEHTKIVWQIDHEIRTRGALVAYTVPNNLGFMREQVKVERGVHDDAIVPHSSLVIPPTATNYSLPLAIDPGEMGAPCSIAQGWRPPLLIYRVFGSSSVIRNVDSTNTRQVGGLG